MSLPISPQKQQKKSTIIPTNVKLGYANNWTQTIVLKMNNKGTSSLPTIFKTKTAKSVASQLEDSRQELLQGKGKLLKSLKDLR